MFWNQGQLIHNGKYRIEQYLGGGGFALTYLATHIKLNHWVVIKTPNLNVQNDPDYPKYVEKFIKEGQILARVCADSHPHIVQVRDLFEENNHHYLVMQYIPGMTLWDLVRQRGKLTEAEAVKYICQIGLALVEVHRKKLLHLDVTPLNIMINSESGNGKAVLIDFGIAADMSPPSTLSRNFGNRAFAPYELIRKGVRHATVDVYCLAASLYYVITGKMPTNSLACKWEEEKLIPPQQHVSNLSKSCCNAIMQGMELEAENRPQSMEKWLNLLSTQQVYGCVETKEAKQSQQKPVNIQSQTQKSDVGVDYSHLEELLKAQNWREADEETRALMLKVANGEEGKDFLDDKLINNFPCTDLYTIDQLWVKYSNGHFGFSVQKRIWDEELGGKCDIETERALGDAIGWRRDGRWLMEDLTYTLDAPAGHLPSDYRWRVQTLRLRSWGIFSLAFRLQKCGIESRENSIHHINY